MDLGFWLATIIFVGTYVAIASEKVHKTTAALVGSSLMLLLVLPGNHNSMLFPAGNPAWLTGEMNSLVTTPNDVYSKYTNFDVIFTLAGMMLLVNLLSGTGVFQYVAIKCAKVAKGSPIRTLVFLVVSTAVLSAFLDNVTTVLLIAPVTMIVAEHMRLNPIPFLMAETMASNIGGTATLIGDPPNLIIGSAAGLGFMEFILNLSWVIVLMMAIYCVFLVMRYGKTMHVTVEQRAQIMELDENAAITDRSNMHRGVAVILLTIVGFLLHSVVGIEPCVVAMAGAGLALLVCKVNVDHALEKIEWSTLFFFLGLFVLVRGAEYGGLMNQIGEWLKGTYSWHPLAFIMTMMWVSAIAAAVTNNVSYTAAMVAVISVYLNGNPVFAGNAPLQELAWWALALSVCLGGNGTLVGAAANLVTAGIASKAGHHVTFKNFMVYGVPVSVATMIGASAYIIIRYYMLCR
ncbi:MAG: ArsB/NhaD family transporter [Victivallaceae bacterium]|nr:ArsB/NhaD family transporter [Victivallaceae bacterium]